MDFPAKLNLCNGVVLAGAGVKASRGVVRLDAMGVVPGASELAAAGTPPRMIGVVGPACLKGVVCC